MKVQYPFPEPTSQTGRPAATWRMISRASWLGTTQPKWCMKIGSTAWDVFTLAVAAEGPAQARARHDQTQKSRYGLKGGDFFFGTENLGSRWRLDRRCVAISARRDPFLALEASDLRVFGADFLGSKTAV